VGRESDEKIAERQARYERPDSGQFKIVDEETEQGVGWVGYWEREWRGEQVYEIGWPVLPTFQRRGIAGTATHQLIEVVRSTGIRRLVHAYPSVDDGPSNGICRKLGVTLLESLEFEYPKGSWMRCNDWRLDLFAETQASSARHA
jgi:RimJ/RimL family protein N-acetyltransferase